MSWPLFYEGALCLSVMTHSMSGVSLVLNARFFAGAIAFLVGFTVFAFINSVVPVLHGRLFPPAKLYFYEHNMFCVGDRTYAYGVLDKRYGELIPEKYHVRRIAFNGLRVLADDVRDPTRMTESVIINSRSPGVQIIGISFSGGTCPSAFDVTTAHTWGAFNTLTYDIQTYYGVFPSPVTEGAPYSDIDLADMHRQITGGEKAAPLRAP